METHTHTHTQEDMEGQTHKEKSPDKEQNVDHTPRERLCISSPFYVPGKENRAHESHCGFQASVLPTMPTTHIGRKLEANIKVSSTIPPGKKPERNPSAHCSIFSGCQSTGGLVSSWWSQHTLGTHLSLPTSVNSEYVNKFEHKPAQT